MPTISTMFYSIGRAYRFGFGQPGFTRKCLRENVWRGVAVVVACREGVGVVPMKRCSVCMAGGMCPVKSLG